MPVFEFKGYSDAGKAITGVRDAENAKVLRAVLRKDGIFLTEVTAERAAAGKVAAVGTAKNLKLKQLLVGRIKTDDIAILTRQLATLLGAGIPLVEALIALIDQVEQERLKTIVTQVKERVNEGASLADALSEHPKAFSNLYVNMVRSGEHSGALDVVLTRLADFTEGQARLRSKIMGTMMYPAIMMLIGLVIVVILLTVVVPKIAKMFEDMQATLPLITRILIGAANFATQFWWVLLLLAVIAAWAFVKWKATEKGTAKFDAILLKLPVFGPLIRMLAIARFSRTLSTLLKSGVPLLTAMGIVKALVTNTVLSGVIEDARTSIREGESIAGPLKRSGQFPPIVYHMISIGERSGQLEEMLANVAVSYDAQVETRIGALTSLLEPVMIVMMGGVVAFIVFSILMPILQMNTLVH
ncbi:type II secretion system inner membrane protein GspF [Vulgatibacter incomptus]|uniref:Type IV fimbrial assembly protein PilC n=1 Tax=Vulgatibacter incomptus TaxID=1391653 RepID=A0A0K1PCU3_9BACT|nr:type II secretion system inner membrane protein GspF [Vulgatibacter incomptus]AKU91322.1 Type IV fimbrial assembly protein PilC [Vulgatibacter incomptus]